MSKNNKRKKNKDKTEAETETNSNDIKNDDLLSAMENFLKDKEPEIKQQEKETEEAKKLRKKLNEKLSEVEKLKSQEKNEEIYDLLVKTLKQNKDLDFNNHNLKEKNAELLLSEKLYHQIKDKYTNLLDEKTIILKEERLKREEITNKCEIFMKDLQAKYESEIPEKNEIIKENDMLRKKFEEYVANTTSIKDNLESQMKLKEQQTNAFEEEFRGQVKAKMEELSLSTQKYAIENSELKSQLLAYNKKFEEVNVTISQYNSMFEKLKTELENRTKDVVQLRKEKNDMMIKEKNSDAAMLDLYTKNETNKKDIEKLTKQLNTMTSLSKNLQEQLNKQKDIVKNLTNPNTTTTTSENDVKTDK